MINKFIVISGVGSISALGCSYDEIYNNYLNNKHFLSLENINDNKYFIGKLNLNSENAINSFLSKKSEFKKYDRTAHLALIASENAINNAKWNNENPIGVSIGSSRGATNLLENYHKIFIEKGNVPVPSSPLTTLGSISSVIASNLNINGYFSEHSVTCSTSFNTIANAIAWIKAGMANRFLAGGSEAPLTNFTIAQMEALGIYSKDFENDFPCRPFDTIDSNKNRFVLGEGAIVFAIEGIEPDLLKKGMIVIESIGYSYEKPPSPTGISIDGGLIEKSMRMALDNMITKDDIDLIICHAPGTSKGDMAEEIAIKNIFGNNIPIVTSNKWKIGHTFASSGGFSIEQAILAMQNPEITKMPFETRLKNFENKKISKVLINATGFGGNASSIIISIVK